MCGGGLSLLGCSPLLISSRMFFLLIFGVLENFSSGRDVDRGREDESEEFGVKCKPLRRLDAICPIHLSCNSALVNVLQPYVVQVAQSRATGNKAKNPKSRATHALTAGSNASTCLPDNRYLDNLQGTGDSCPARSQIHDER